MKAPALRTAFTELFFTVIETLHGMVARDQKMHQTYIFFSKMLKRHTHEEIIHVSTYKQGSADLDPRHALHNALHQTVQLLKEWLRKSDMRNF